MTALSRIAACTLGLLIAAPMAHAAEITRHRFSFSQLVAESNTAPYSASLSWLQRSGPWQSMLSVLRMGPIDAGFSYVPGFDYTVPSYTTLDWSVARSLRVLDHAVELRLTGINLLGRHQELANRPLQAQAEFAGRPASQVSRQVWMALETIF